MALRVHAARRYGSGTLEDLNLKKGYAYLRTILERTKKTKLDEVYTSELTVYKHL